MIVLLLTESLLTLWNLHYAAISTDTDYQAPSPKQTNTIHSNVDYLSEWEVSRLLDTLHSTATGLDELPAWFIKLAAPAFCKPITRLFNCSITMSVVPSQWKTTYIRPIPKVSAPLSHSDYRPISITPVLFRLVEKLVVRHFLYPTFSAPPSTLNFSDQFAFRPSGSTTAALIYIFHTLTQLLTNYQYVSVIALDVTKAFDTVRHSTLRKKMADLAMPDKVYNWLVSYFNGHRHCTRYGMSSSALLEISAGIIQGSEWFTKTFTYVDIPLFLLYFYLILPFVCMFRSRLS